MSLNSPNNIGSKYVNNQQNMIDKSTTGIRDFGTHFSETIIYWGLIKKLI